MNLWLAAAWYAARCGRGNGSWKGGLGRRHPLAPAARTAWPPAPLDPSARESARSPQSPRYSRSPSAAHRSADRSRCRSRTVLACGVVVALLARATQREVVALGVALVAAAALYGLPQVAAAATKWSDGRRGLGYSPRRPARHTPCGACA